MYVLNGLAPLLMNCTLLAALVSAMLTVWNVYIVKQLSQHQSQFVALAQQQQLVFA
jgi:cell division protein FtsL